MISDGKDVEHATEKRGRLLVQTHYDQIWHALEHTAVSMVGEHSEHGGMYIFIDNAGEKVGTVNFDKSDRFLAGTFYGNVYTSGRTITQNQAFAEFFNRLRGMYA